MPQYNVVADRPPAGLINSFVEAPNAKAAVAEFRKDRKLDHWERVRSKATKTEVKIEAVATLIGGNEPSADEPEVMYASAAEAIASVAEEGEPVATAVAELEPEPEPSPIAPRALDVLRPHGVTDHMMDSLEAAGLGTVPKIVAYAKLHGSLTGVPGIGQSGSMKLKAAIQAYQAANEG